MAGSIQANEAVYKKQSYTYVPPTPPNDLIASTSYTLDFNDRKFIQIGVDPTNSFNVMVHIITSSRYVSIAVDYLKRVYSIMGHILSNILENPEKNANITFLSDSNIILSKMVYKGENVLVIESQSRNGCRILLNRKNLLKLTELEWILYECIARHATNTLDNVKKQMETMIKYYEERFFPTVDVTKSKLLTYIKEVPNVTITTAIEPLNETNFISEIKHFAAEELADAWIKKLSLRNNMSKECDENDGPTSYDWNDNTESQFFTSTPSTFNMYQHTERSTWAPRKLEF